MIDADLAAAGADVACRSGTCEIPQPEPPMPRETLHDEATRSRASAEAPVSTEAEMLYRLADAANRAASLETVYRTALDTIEGVLGVERASILLFDRDHVMRFQAYRGLSARYRAAVEGHSPWTHEDRCPTAIVIEDVEQDPALAVYGTLFQDEDIRALAFVPLVYDSRLLGKFMLYSAEPRSFDEATTGAAQSIADQLASAIGRRRAAEERERLIDELKTTVRLNELFAGVLAHDLRNPLGAILTAAYVLERRAETEDLRAPARRIVVSGERMARMIEQLLDFTRARVGDGIALHRRDTTLDALCRQLVAELADTYPNARFELALEPDVRGSWDPDRLAQVLSNLVGNACQHGAPNGVVRVELSAVSERQARLRIENAGTIASELLPVLFDPFRGTKERSDGSQGLGLGLFITRWIVGAHGGHISVHTDAGRTRFEVLLPRNAGSN
jgi:signal transduction histidine kinase